MGSVSGLKNEVDMDSLNSYLKTIKLPEQIKRAMAELEELKKYPNMEIEATRRDFFIRDYFQGISDAYREGLLKGQLKVEQERKHKVMLEIAKNMISLGYPIEQIVHITGLSVDEINKLKALT
jgi:predicted transposase/invertase (TIGR01784 family)